MSLSDADNQMGGTGGDTGAPPDQEKSPTAESATGAGRSGGTGGSETPGDDDVTEESKESFPASDPPANY